MKMLLNDEKGGVELSFDARPADNVRDALKAAGYRWHRQKCMWYAKQTQASMDLARRLSSGSPVEPEPAQALDRSKPSKRTYSMRYTFSGYYAPDGTYTKARYSFNERNSTANHYCITVYTDSYGAVPTPADVEVVSNSDSQSDYFEHTHWNISPDNPDYLGVFAAKEAAEAHAEKLQKRRGAPHTEEQEIACKMRLFGYTREKALESVRREQAEQERRRNEITAARAEAKALAEAVQAARDSGDAAALNSALAELREKTAAFSAAVQAEGHAKALVFNLAAIERAKARGECTVLEGVVFLEETHTYRHMFQGTIQTVHSLVAFDAETGERLDAGEFDSPEARNDAKVKILHARRCA